MISDISARSNAFICNGVCRSDNSSLEYTSDASTPNCSNCVTNQSDMALTARVDTSCGYFIVVDFECYIVRSISVFFLNQSYVYREKEKRKREKYNIKQKNDKKRIFLGKNAKLIHVVMWYIE